MLACLTFWIIKLHFYISCHPCFNSIYNLQSLMNGIYIFLKSGWRPRVALRDQNRILNVHILHHIVVEGHHRHLHGHCHLVERDHRPCPGQPDHCSAHFYSTDSGTFILYSDFEGHSRKLFQENSHIRIAIFKLIWFQKVHLLLFKFKMTGK